MGRTGKCKHPQSSLIRQQLRLLSTPRSAPPPYLEADAKKNAPKNILYPALSAPCTRLGTKIFRQISTLAKSKINTFSFSKTFLQQQVFGKLKKLTFLGKSNYQK